MSLISAVIVLAVTWIKTVDTWKMSRGIRHFRPTLTTLLLRGGMSLIPELPGIISGYLMCFLWMDDRDDILPVRVTFSDQDIQS